MVWGNLARRRRDIATRMSVFIDLLSWRYANAVTGSSAARNAVHAAAMRVQKQSSVVQPLLQETNQTLSLPQSNDREIFKRLVQSIDNELSLNVNPLLRQLERDYEKNYNPLLLDDNKNDKSGNGGNKLGKDDRHRVEDANFLDLISQLLLQGKYHVVSEEECAYARGHAYGFSLPVSIKWSNYDKELIANISARLYNDTRCRDSASADGKVRRPKEASHALVFHRGVGVDQQTGFYFGFKIDELIRRSALWIYGRLLAKSSRLTEYAAGRARHARTTFVDGVLANLSKRVSQTANTFYADQFSRLEERLRARVLRLNPSLKQVDLGVALELPPALKNIQLPNSYSRQSASSSLPSKPQEQAQQVIVQTKDKLLERAFSSRVSLQDYKLNFFNFFSRITLQEPTYREVIVVYRLMHPNPSTSVPFSEANEFSTNHFSKNDRRAPRRSPNARNIFIRHFRDIPMADLELIMPEKQVFLTIRDRISYATWALLGSSALYNLIVNPFHITSSAWIAAAMASVSFFGRISWRMYSSWAYYSVFTEGFLSENNVSSGTSTIAWIAHEAQEQLCKEIAVTFLALVELSVGDQEQQNETMSLQSPTYARIVERCQAILNQKYSVDVHIFDPSRSLAVLQEVGLVTRRADTQGKVTYTLVEETTL